MVHRGQDQQTVLDTSRMFSETPTLASWEEEAVLSGEVSPNSDADLGREPAASPDLKHSSDRSVPNAAVNAKPLWRVWAPEMASILLSILITVAMVVVCAQYDQRSLPDWPLSITLNTFVAFFSMGAKAAFMLPVSVAISQMQWSWFMQERPLYDFYLFDQASRGPWGSLILLKRIHVKHFVSLGAFLMIVSVATSPVTQLAISYPLRNEAVQGEATVRTSQSLRTAFAEMVRDGVEAATSMNASEIYSPITPPAKTTCSSGNCTFESYDSLGVCVEIANVTSQLLYEHFADGEPVGIPFYDSENNGVIVPGSGNITKAYLPDGLALVHQHHYASVMGILSGNRTYGFQGTTLSRARIASLALIYAKPVFARYPTSQYAYQTLEEAIGVQHDALEILYYLCVQSYTTTVQNGHESTKVINSVSEPDHDGGVFLDLKCPSRTTNSSGECRRDQGRYNETMYLAPPPNSKQPNNRFAVNYEALEKVAMSLVSYQAHFGIYLFHNQKYPEGRYVLTGTSFADKLFKVVLYVNDSCFNATLREQRINTYFQNVATGLSYQFLFLSNDDALQGRSTLNGQAWKLQSYVQMNWGWISFLVVEMVLAAVFLACVIVSQLVHQRRQQQGEATKNHHEVVKDSALAYMVALGSQCHVETGTGLRPRDELEKLAKNLRVKLEGGEVVPCRVAAENEPDITVGDGDR